MSGRKSSVNIHESIAFVVHRYARLQRRHFLLLAQKNGFDLTPEQWFVMNKLKSFGPQSQSDLCESVFADRPNMSRLLATLEAKGYVRRNEDAEDARKTRVSLTPRGARAHDAFSDVVEQERRSLFEGLDDRDFDELRRVLAQLERNILRAEGAS